MKKMYFLVSILFLLPIAGNTQTENKSFNTYWFDAGFGSYNSIEKTSGFVFDLSANLINNKTLYKIRFINYEEFLIFGPEPTEYFNHIGVLVGKGFSGKYAQVFCSGGLGITEGFTRGDFINTENDGGWFNISSTEYYEKDRFFVLSIPVEVDFSLKPLKFMDAGITLYGDLNYVRPACGIIFKVGFGKLR